MARKVSRRGREGNRADMFADALSQRLRSLANILEVAASAENDIATIGSAAVKAVHNRKTILA